MNSIKKKENNPIQDRLKKIRKHKLLQRKLESTEKKTAEDSRG
jgi:hypothetical protein